MSGTDLCYTPALELARAIRERAVSPVEVVDAVLARIEKLNPIVNAYCTVAADQARAAARKAEQAVMAGDTLGPLHGVPVSFKDLTPTAGIRTTFGSKIFEHNVPTEDAVLVQRMKAAGGITIGKTNTAEFGCKGVTDNRIFGVTRNPWNPALVAGGSTGGGAAALACGMAPLAEGSDLAGSIRIPSACCGVVGLKTTPGRVPTYPQPNGWASLSVHGPLARTVRDAALMLRVMSGADPRDPISLPGSGEDFVAACDQPIGKPRLAWSRDLGYAPVEPIVARIAEAAAKSFLELGCSVDEAHPGFEDPDLLFRSLTGPMRAAELAPYAEWVDEVDPILSGRIRTADNMTASDYERRLHQRTELYQKLRVFFETYDFLLTPTIAVLPFPVDAPYPPTHVAGRPIASPIGWFPFTFPFNLAGVPAITIPAGWTDDGLPVGLQIVGPRLAEAGILRLAAAYEAARPWADRRPSLG